MVVLSPAERAEQCPVAEMEQSVRAPYTKRHTTLVSVLANGLYLSLRSCCLPVVHSVDTRTPREELVAPLPGFFDAHGYGLWGARLHDREELVGFGGFWYFHTLPKLELLYGIAPQHWNRGLATEIARTLVRYGFEELEFSEVRASTDAPNAASARVLEKAGLRFERRAVVDGLETLFYWLPRSAFQPGGYR
jgi:RimJ/RimL family protein N-acetyltransferase